jgi:hypothetical protein
LERSFSVGDAWRQTSRSNNRFSISNGSSAVREKVPDIFRVDNHVAALSIVADLDEYKNVFGIIGDFRRKHAREKLVVNGRSLSVVSHGNQTDRSSDRILE